MIVQNYNRYTPCICGAKSGLRKFSDFNCPAGLKINRAAIPCRDCSPLTPKTN